jgi:hypothetical protein
MSIIDSCEGVKALVKAFAPETCTQVPWALVGTVTMGDEAHPVNARGMVTASTHEQAFAVAVPWVDVVAILAGSSSHRDAILAIVAEGPDAIKARAERLKRERPEVMATVEAAVDAAVEKTSKEVRRVRVTIK